MTEFKVGTRVTAMLVDGSREVTGTLLEEGQEYEFTGERTVAAEGHDWFVKANTVRGARTLVGPAPEPVEGPIYVAPFEANEGIVYDANSAAVVRTCVGDYDFYDRCNFAVFVANALNAAVKASQ